MLVYITILLEYKMGSGYCTLYFEWKSLNEIQTSYANLPICINCIYYVLYLLRGVDKAISAVIASFFSS